MGPYTLPRQVFAQDLAHDQRQIQDHRARSGAHHQARRLVVFKVRSLTAWPRTDTRLIRATGGPSKHTALYMVAVQTCLQFNWMALLEQPRDIDRDGRDPSDTSTAWSGACIRWRVAPSTGGWHVSNLLEAADKSHCRIVGVRLLLPLHLQAC